VQLIVTSIFILLGLLPIVTPLSSTPNSRPTSKPTSRPVTPKKAHSQKRQATSQPTSKPKSNQRSSTWPAFPDTSKKYHAMIKQFPAPPYDEDTHNTPNAYEISQILLKKPRHRLIAGWRPIFQELQKAYSSQKKSILLWGTAHDSRTQFQRFISLLGGTGLAGIKEVIVEMFYADGKWPGIPQAQQSGDNTLLHNIVHKNSQSALRAFARRQHRLNYVVWKYGYIDDMVNFPIFARGRGLTVHGCEPPAALRKKLKVTFEQRLRIREYHCALANQLQDNDKRQIAMFWGRGHILPDGIRRFISYQARVTSVYVYGGGKRLSGLEIGLKDDIQLMTPLLIPLSTISYKPPKYRKKIEWLRRYVLLLPKALAYKKWQPSRNYTSKRFKHNLILQAGIPAIRIGKKHFPAPKRTRKLQLSAGDYILRMQDQKSKRLIFGHIRLFKRGSTVLRMYRKRLFIEYNITK